MVARTPVAPDIFGTSTWEGPVLLDAHHGLGLLLGSALVDFVGWP